MEVMCTDLVACGECFVPDDKAGQTLIRYCGFVPIEVDEALDWETSHFLGDDLTSRVPSWIILPIMYKYKSPK